MGFSCDWLDLNKFGGTPAGSFQSYIKDGQELSLFHGT